MISDSWREYNRRIAEEIAEKGLEEFKSLPTVRKTIYCGMSKNRIEELRLLRDSHWRSKLSTIGLDNGTAVHQAYSLMRFEMVTNVLVGDLKLIFEFGGGYGEMARLVYLNNPNVSYFSYDLPAMTELQKYYLGMHCPNMKIVYTSCAFPELFIAICSLSEAPISIREKVLEYEPSHLLIRSQHSWDMIDNKWFRDYAKKNYDTVVIEPPPMYSNHFYLFATGLKS